MQISNLNHIPRFSFIIFISTILLHMSVFSQLGESKYYFKTDLQIKTNCKNTNFTIHDSISLVSINKKISLRFYDVFLNHNKTEKEYKKKTYTKLDGYYNGCIIKNRKGFIQLRNIFMTSFNGTITSKKITALEIIKKNKEMLIYFDFTKYKKKKHIDLGKISIEFKEGKYKITNINYPKLIKTNL